MKNNNFSQSQDPSEIADALFWASLRRTFYTAFISVMAITVLMWSGCHFA